MDAGKWNSKQVNDLIKALGSTAEMAHIFYTGMVNAGAAPDEARAGMDSFIRAWLTLATNPPKKDGENNE